jgi:hypothetical protein
MAPQTPSTAPHAATPSRSSGNTTTTNDVDIEQMKEAFEEMGRRVLELEAQRSASHSVVKIGKVEPFSGERGTLKVFLAQLRIYFSNNATRIVSEQDKVLTASSFLTGEAMRWFAPYVTSRIETINDEQLEPETILMFSSFAYFEKRLHQLFGTVNEELDAIHRIKGIRQYGSVGDYISKFLQVSGYLKWSDQGLRDQFYENLKDNVKDRISQIIPRPDTFKKMMEAASQIDMQIFTRRMERGNYQHRPRHQANTSQRRTRDRDGDVIMQMNATLTKEEKKKLIEKKACFNCGIPGHFANKCRKPKKVQGTANHGQRQQIATAIHVYTPDESSTEENSETDDELPEQYKKERIQEQTLQRQRLMNEKIGKEIEQALNNPMETRNDIDELIRQTKKIEVPRTMEGLLREWTTLNEEEIQKALKKPSINVRHATIQAPVDTHEDAHRMVPRNDQSHEVRTQSPKNSYPGGCEPDKEEPEDSSESTDYEDSSLIESFHTQLALQGGDEKAISQPSLHRDQKKPHLDPYERIKEQLAELRKKYDKPEPSYTQKSDCTCKNTHDKEICKSNRSYNTTWTKEDAEKSWNQGDDLCNCMPAKAICWEESQHTWKEHIEMCKKCHEWTHRECPIHGYVNKILATIYEQISNSNGHRLCNGQLGHVPNCICMHYPNLGGCMHNEVHWTTCFDDGCEFHHLSKKINRWFPKTPGIALRSKFICPQGNPECQCAYEESGHPAHSSLPQEKCRAVFCQDHHDGLFENHLEEHFRSVQSYMDRHLKKHLIAATINPKYRTIIILAEVNEVKLRILLDSGATGNHMNPEVAAKLRIKQHETTQWVNIVGIDGKPVMQGYRMRTDPILLKSGPYATTISFDITAMTGYDAVLGMPWLQEQNPVIDWTTGTVSIDNRILRTKLGEYEELTSLREGLGNNLPQAGLKKNANSGEQEAQKVMQPTRKQTNETQQERFAEKKMTQEQPVQQPQTRPKPKEIYEQELKEVLAKLPKKYHDFIELFVKKEYRLPNHEKEYEARIPLKPGFTPPSVKQTHKSRDQLELENKFVREFLAAGYIREGRGPASSRPMFVPKKDGTERLVIDYRTLNNGTIDDANKAPHQEQKRDLLQGAKIMTVFDIQWGYYNLRTAEEDIWKTAFLTDMGLFEWVVAPMGLKRLPAEFARFMTHVLIKFLNKLVAVYFDDIIVYSKNVEEHDSHVRAVMTELMKAGLTLKIKKCEFDTTTVNYLGMIYTPEGLKIQPEKMDAILNWPTPTCVKDIQGFLGASGYVRRYLQNYSEIARPMTELLKKDLEFEWTEEREKAFRQIKELVKNAPILMLHNPDKQHLIRPDASGYALGIVLEQPDDDGKWRPVAFFSRKFTTAERNYDVHDRELLAIVEAFKQWRHYLQGVKEETIVKSDHHNLKYFTTTKELVGRQIRWAEYLSKFKFRIEHIKGKENVIADALSRRPDYAIGLEQPKTNILKEDKDGIRYNNKAVLAAAITVNETGFHQRMIQETKKDKTLMTAIMNKEATQQNGLALWNGSILVPTAMVTEIIKRHHDPPLQGHQGIDKTMEKIQRQYYFPQMRKRVHGYISMCDSCNRNKPINHQPYGKMQLPETPDAPWKSITVDFIQGLPESKDPITGLRYTEAIVIVDRLTKYVIIRPVPKDMTAEQCAILMLREVFSWTGLPTKIISDRDKLFRSKYWQTITKACGIEHSLSTANHQQTDGPTERMIQFIEQHLRHYLDWNQDNWVELLPLAQFALNNAKNTSTGEVPHFANLGRYPRMSWTTISTDGRSNEAILQATHMQRMHNTMSKDIKWAEQKMKRYYDMKREDAPTLQKGERVYLLRRTPGSKTFNIKTKRPSDKFDAVKYGPFRIVKKLENDNYQLQLPARMRIHPIFHISLLEPTKNPENGNDEADDEEYEVEKVLDRKQENGQIYYLIRWKGYSPEDDSWEPVTNLNCHDKIQEYRATIGLEKKKQQARKNHPRPGRWRRRN